MANSDGDMMTKSDKTDPRLLLLSPHDNVLVLRGAIEGGEQIFIRGICVTLKAHIGLGHKLAGAAILSGAKVMKYGAPIGSTTRDITIGEHVHIDNMKSDYTPTYALDEASLELGDA